MRKIIYEDCNNNAIFLKELFIQIKVLSNTKLSWSISNLDFISVDRGDFIGGVPSIEMEELYNFYKKMLDEHIVIVTHNNLMDLLKSIKTIYEGKFEVIIRGKPLTIKIFDGDIIEINGEMENELKF